MLTLLPCYHISTPGGTLKLQMTWPCVPGCIVARSSTQDPACRLTLCHSDLRTGEVEYHCLRVMTHYEVTIPFLKTFLKSLNHKQKSKPDIPTVKKQQIRKCLPASGGDEMERALRSLYLKGHLCCKGHNLCCQVHLCKYIYKCIHLLPTSLNCWILSSLWLCLT